MDVRASAGESDHLADAEGVDAVRHMMIVGGRVDEWNAMSDADWMAKIAEIGGVADAARVRWVTVLPFGPGAHAINASSPSDQSFAHTGARYLGRAAASLFAGQIGNCGLIVDRCADGRERFASAVASISPDEAINEASVAAALYEPADAEPDLVLVLGPPTELPISLVWELAYAELVFTDVAWSAVDGAVVEAAIDDFSSRRRRFGGLDSDDE